MTTINTTDPRLTAFVLGELSAEEALEIQKAIEQSAELQTEAAAIRQVVAQIETAMKEEPLLREKSGGHTPPGESESTRVKPGGVCPPLINDNHLPKHNHDNHKYN